MKIRQLFFLNNTYFTTPLILYFYDDIIYNAIQQQYMYTDDNLIHVVSISKSTK